MTLNHSELLDRYGASVAPASRRPQVARVKAFLGWLGERPPTADTIRQWLDHLRSEGYADGTVNKDFITLASFFRRAGLEWPFRRGEAPVVRESQVYAPALGTPRTSGPWCMWCGDSYLHRGQ